MAGGAAVLGVDVSLGRGLDVVLMEGATVKETWSRLGQTALRDLLLEHRPAAVAIDAPPAPGLGLLRDARERARLAVPPAEGRHLARRVAEYELSRRGIGSHQTHYDEARLFSWMTAGFATFAAAREAGYEPFVGDGDPGGRAIEVFPYASYVVLSGCLSPGHRWRLAWRRAVLAEAGVTGLALESPIDVLDAACAALTAERFLAGDGAFVGDPREGAIVLPAPPRESYRRCAPPDGEVHERRDPRRPRLCECGCGVPARRRFVPGHASHHRARLLRDVRAGDEARAELARLGWTARVRED